MIAVNGYSIQPFREAERFLLKVLFQYRPVMGLQPREPFTCTRQGKHGLQMRHRQQKVGQSAAFFFPSAAVFRHPYRRVALCQILVMDSPRTAALIFDIENKVLGKNIHAVMTSARKANQRRPCLFKQPVQSCCNCCRYCSTTAGSTSSCTCSCSRGSAAVPCVLHKAMAAAASRGLP